MRQKSGAGKAAGGRTRSGTSGAQPVDTFSAEEKIRVVLEGLRGEEKASPPNSLSARGHRLIDVLWLVEGVPRGR